MNRKKFSLFVMGIVLLLALALAGCSSKEAAVFPSKDITLVVPYAAGGGTDLAARALAKEAEEILGTTIAIVNKPGGGSAPGMLEVSQAKPDGYNLVFVAPPVVTMYRLGTAEISYRDFQPVSGVNFDPFTVTVAADAPWNTVEEFLDYARENPGKVKVGTTTPGGAWHTGALALESETGVDFNIIPFEKGAIPAVVDLLGGNLDAVTVSVPEVAPNIDSGELKMLAVAGDNRVDVYPDVPTFKEVGIDVPPVGAYRGVMAPKETPEDVVKTLDQAFKDAAASAGFKEFMTNNILGQMYMPTSEWTSFLEEQDEVFAKLIENLE
ncbi:tripartite tricarboxylate transporter substrate binding protein [Bacillus carboniphilus]|uniref:Tripartite tricarboxylate transporter substrate binding protein n=1 Tax=Bacillus carboniphilus TaxID=86663 RepID=A0ABP3FWR4_9BACI